MENAKWYVIHTYSGYENKVKTNIEKTIDNRNLHHKVIEIRLPEEEIVEVKDNVKKAVKRKLFPGYLFVKMIMDSETWYIIRNTRGVTSFVGPGSKPVALTDEEIDNLALEDKRVHLNFEIGDSVRITDGPLTDFIGEVQTIDEANGKFVVLVSMFGRETPVELEFGQAEILS